MSILNALQSHSLGNLLMIVLLLLSFSGYYFELRKNKVPVAFAPGIIVSFIVCSVYLGGILNLLFLTATLVFLCGIILMVINAPSFFRINKPNRFSVTAIGIWFIIISFFFVALHNSIINGYDDYSHWATLAKVMLANNRLPRYTDTIITFTSYPPGSACFIYYFCRFAGNIEGYYLFAQYLMKLSFLFSLFCVCSHKRSIKLLFPLTSIVILLLSIHNVTSHTLSVDGLLSCSGIFCIMSAYYYRNNIKKLLPVFLLSTSCVVLIKNSGMFFWAATLSLLLLDSEVVTFKQLKSKHALITFSWFFCPLGIYYIWQRHVLLVFEDGLNAKHSMSASHYSTVLSEKSMSDIMQELRIIISRIINPRYDHLLPIIAGLFIIYFLARLYKGRESSKLLIWAVVVSFFYQIGTLCMYTLSMPHKEILYQNGNDYLRYNGSLVTFMSGFLVFYFARVVKNSSNKQCKLSLVAITCALLLGLIPKLNITDLDPTVKCYLHYADRVSAKQEIESQLSTIASPNNRNVLVRTDKKTNEAGYINFMMRYLLLSNDFEISVLEQDAEFDHYWKEQSNRAYGIDLIQHKLLVRK